MTLDDRITRFVRETLGCSCPDEAFQQIEAAPLDHPDPVWDHVERIAIGGRLLVFLATPAGQPPDPPALARLLKAGVADRDREGFNRFRLACVCETPEGCTALNAELLQSLFPDDEKVHLHLLAPTDLATLYP